MKCIKHVLIFFVIFCLFPICKGSAFALSDFFHQTISLDVLGTYHTGIFDEGAAEIVSYDPSAHRLFVCNASQASIDIIDITYPSTPLLVRTIDISSYGGSVNSVAFKNGVLAAAVENENKQKNGLVIFFNTDGDFLNSVVVGALPDMLTFTPNGRYLLVANEGEPNDDYTIDPEGSVSIIKISKAIETITQKDVKTADFKAFNTQSLSPDIRFFGPNATVAQDLEPEYIAVSDNSKKAWVTCQENNAIVAIDINSAKTESIFGLGTKNHMLARNSLDVSNKDGGINITTWPVNGMYQPDAIQSYTTRGKIFLVMANEGDSRDYEPFSEEARVKDVVLDPDLFPNYDELQQNDQLGRLLITTALGDIDNDGDFDALYSFGGRSFSIRETDGTIVYDSGNEFETIIEELLPDYFNANNDDNDSFDSRSDDKGPEPEGVAIGRVFFRTYAFIGLERVGGVMVYDITDPYHPEFIQYINNRYFSENPEASTAGDLGPEGMLFIPMWDSPIWKPLLVVANEISGTTTIYQINTQFSFTGFGDKND